MSELICITNRKLCREDFFKRLEKITSSHPKAVILREKDLSAGEYTRLAQVAYNICFKNNMKLILHSFKKSALELNINSIHVPMQILRAMDKDERSFFQTLGASCHTVSEAKEAEKLGCTYITASNIYETDCKKGLKGKGTDFLREVCRSVNIPVYALGGISPLNYSDVIKAGAKGACVMSGFMTCENPKLYIKQFTE